MATSALAAHPQPDILNVALSSGFSDPAHLTRLFKRRFGVTPGQLVR
jgi:AraC family transcriptional regulator